ncbi:MAG: cyclase family protein [Xanthomonadales bacterium]|nr:cyclase family protein [Xanthomonadales bacterium]
MNLELEHGGHRWRVALQRGVDLSIPLGAGADMPEFFIGGTMTAETLRAGDFHADTREGGSCNVTRFELTPHCHGTHTEGIGHITHERAAVQTTVDSRPCVALLATVTPEPAERSDDEYHCALEPGEPLISAAELERAVAGAVARQPVDVPFDALVLRARPLQRPLPVRDYNQDPYYPLLSVAAMRWLSEQPIRHLLIEMPSLDRAEDGGRLGNHRLFWGLPAGFDEVEAADPGRSITEMVRVPDELEDGLHWLEPGLSPLQSDATPSRPMLYPLEFAS